MNMHGQNDKLILSHLRVGISNLHQSVRNRTGQEKQVISLSPSQPVLDGLKQHVCDWLVRQACYRYLKRPLSFKENPVD